MPSSRLFWRLFLTWVGLNCAAAIVAGLFLTGMASNSETTSESAVKWIWLAIALVSLSAVVFACFLVHRTARTVAALNTAASAIAAGEYDRRVYVPGRDDLSALAGTLNRISESLGHHSTKLAQTVTRQATVLSGMVEGVIAVDNRERIVLANAAACRLYGIGLNPIEGRPLLEVIRNHALHAAVASVLETGKPQRMESPRSSTQTFHADIHVQPLPGVPCPGAVLVIHDTTELQRLEAIRRDFVANVSHELKTPLSSIKAYTETLQNGADAATTERFLARIDEQVDRLHRLIIDMLMLTRIESAHQAFEIVPVDVADVVRICLEAHRHAAETKHVILSAQPNAEPGDRPRQVLADREGLREILDNLLDNAIKYTLEGGSVTITWEIEDRGESSEERAGENENQVSIEQRNVANIDDPISNNALSSPLRPQPPAPNLLLSVTDTGIGIKPQDQERIFERFYRVDKARSRELGGTGLGLSIVKHLALAFGGQVTVQSTLGQGSTFIVRLPLA